MKKRPLRGLRRKNPRETGISIQSGSALPGASLQGNRQPTKKRKARRRIMVTVGGLAMCMVAPSCIFHVLLYRQNLAAAREPLPKSRHFTAQDRLLVLAPHCDDETLGVGGTIAAARAMGAEVRVVFMTNGDASLSTRIGEDARSLRRHSFRQLVGIRQREALAAMSALGVSADDVIFLGYPDCGTKQMWEVNWSDSNPYRSPTTGASHSPYDNSYTPDAPYCGQQALRDVQRIMMNWRPTVVFTTHPSDTHPDHWAAYAYAEAALQALRLEPSSKAWANRTELLTFLVHHGLWPAPHGYHPDAPLSPPADLKNLSTDWVQIPLGPEARAAKETALRRYVSQLTFTPQFLRGFLRQNELLGAVLTATDRRSSTAVTDQPNPILKDPVRDSLLHDFWPSADLQSVQFVTSKQPDVIKKQPDVIKLRVQTAAAASSRLRYQLVLHTVDKGATGSVRAWRINAGFNGGRARAILNSLAGSASSPKSLAASNLARGFEIEIPRAALRLGDDSTLLLSSTTQLGSRVLDQTETGTLRLLPAIPPSPLRALPVNGSASAAKRTDHSAPHGALAGTT